MGLFGNLGVARSGLTINERALYVTGHNITNTNTEGYVRQQIEPTSSFYQDIPDVGQVGYGADIQGIRQVRNNFLDGIYRQEVETLGKYEIMDKTYRDIQTILDEPFDDGLQSVLNDFWNSWQELAKDPDSLTLRATVRQNGEALTRQFNHIGDQLGKLQDDLNQEVYVRINKVNEYTKEMASLNMEILKSEIAGNDANDLKDKRNLIMDKLSNLVGAKFNETIDGHISVDVGGHLLVDKATYRKLEVRESSEYGSFYMPKLEGTNTDVNINNGELKGFLDSRGMVLGALGSEANGSPNTRVDINLVIDNSDTSSDNLDKIKENVKEYVKSLNGTGLDYNLRIVTFSDDATVNSTVWDKDMITENSQSFYDAINNISEGVETENSFSNVISSLEGIDNFRDEATKYAVVFTGESVDGETDISSATANSYINDLNEMGMKLSVVSNSDYENENGTEDVGWSDLTEATGGSFYDIDSEDFGELLKEINYDINENKNDEIDNYESSGNVIPDLRKQLNSLVNIVFREINKLHSSGKTLEGKTGVDFFVPIDDNFPLEMGNVKINPDFSNLNNIVASVSDKMGDNEMALNIANLRNEKILSDKSGELSIDGFYQAIIMTVGTEAAGTSRIYENQKELVSSADDFRKSITEVSMDEEMSNMIRYKFAYGASSRLINVINEMIETILTRIGN
jgi:flagellar hook-associated protein 1 FlgK